MIDTIKCETEHDLTEAFYEKLLLGAINEGLDRKEMKDHNPVNSGQGTDPALSHRPIAAGKGKERQFSDDETLVMSSRRWNSMHANRPSTKQNLNESPTDDAPRTPDFQEMPSNIARPRHTSPPPAG